MKALTALPNSIISYFRSVLAELKAMEWMPLGEVIKFTLVVIAITVLTVFILLGIDTVMVAVRGLLLNRF